MVQLTQTNKCDTSAKDSIKTLTSTVPEKMFKTNITSTQKSSVN